MPKEKKERKERKRVENEKDGEKDKEGKINVVTENVSKKEEGRGERKKKRT